MHPASSSNQSAPREGYVPVENAQLFYRETGRGHPIIILHGGPDFDHNYLLPELDRLAHSFRLIYYDQRGRGKSGGEVEPEQVGINTEMKDLDDMRQYFQFDTTAVLGHSWGGLLAMEYAVRYPQRVSHLILLNTAPASHEDLVRFRNERLEKSGGDLEKMKILASTTQYVQGDLETDADYYRIHFRSTLRRPEQLEKVVKSLRANVTPEGIRKARAIEDRLYDETWLLSEYNLLPKLNQLNIPTLIIHGDHDFVPLDCAVHIAQAIPGARLIVLRECGHFSYIEHPEEVYKEITGFIRDGSFCS